MATARFSRKVPFLIRSFIAFGLLVLFFYAYLAPSNGLLALLIKLQFSAALYGLGIWSLAVIALALVSGRVFCSALCPLGTWQELFGRIGSAFRRGKGPALAVCGYVPPPRLRFVIPLATGLGLALPIFPIYAGLRSPLGLWPGADGAFRGQGRALCPSYGSAPGADCDYCVLPGPGFLQLVPGGIQSGPVLRSRAPGHEDIPSLCLLWNLRTKMPRSLHEFPRKTP